MTSSLLLERPEHDGDHAEVAGVDEVDGPLAVVGADLAVGALEEQVSGREEENRLLAFVGASVLKGMIFN